jgi:hypothetical protein
MKQLIEYKLWGGQIPYFVADPLGDIYDDSKHYGVSKDTDSSYLPDTVRILTTAELLAIVLQSNLTKGDNEGLSVPMTDVEKQAFLYSWFNKNGISN